MSINYQTHNILHTMYAQRQYNLNVLYTSTDSLFDKIMEDVSNINLINNQVFLNFALSYGLCIINDPLDFAQNLNTYSGLYANKILLLHNDPAVSLKKEDLFLLRSSLSKFPCFCFTPNYELWSNPNIVPLSYGVKEYLSPISKTKDIVLISHKEHRQTKLIFDNLKQTYPTAELLDIDYSRPYDDILQTISEYKICIDLVSYYNVLCGVSVGCYGITGKRQYSDKYIDQISNYQELIAIINDKLSANVTNIEHMQQYIKQKYSQESFLISMKNTITNHSTRAVVL